MLYWLLYTASALYHSARPAVTLQKCSLDCDSIIIKNLDKSSQFLILIQKQHGNQNKTPVQNWQNKNQKKSQKNKKNTKKNKKVIKKTKTKKQKKTKKTQKTKKMHTICFAMQNKNKQRPPAPLKPLQNNT